MPLDEHSALSPDELQRYHRHLILPNVGEEGQRRLKAARVLLIGAGGLGSPAAFPSRRLLASAIWESSMPTSWSWSNLQRQVLHGTRDVGRPKVSSAEARLRDLNPHVEIATYHARLTSANAMELLGGYDIIVDGSWDNFQTRYLVINDACVLLGKPNVYGSVIPLRWTGVRLQRWRRAVLSLSVPRATTARTPDSQLCRRRRLRRPAWTRRHHSGDGDDQIFHRCRRATRRAPAGRGRTAHALPHHRARA